MAQIKACLGAGVYPGSFMKAGDMEVGGGGATCYFKEYFIY